MTTMAQRLGAGESTVTVIKGGSRRAVSDPELAGAIARAYALRQKIVRLDERLREAKALLARRAEELAAGGSTVSLQAGGVRCTLTMRYEAQVPGENVPELRRLLGRRFRDLVRARVRHTATSRLVAEAGDEVLGLIELKRLSPQFKWSAR